MQKFEFKILILIKKQWKVKYESKSNSKFKVAFVWLTNLIIFSIIIMIIVM